MAGSRLQLPVWVLPYPSYEELPGLLLVQTREPTPHAATPALGLI